MIALEIRLSRTWPIFCGSQWTGRVSAAQVFTVMPVCSACGWAAAVDSASNWVRSAGVLRTRVWVRWVFSRPSTRCISWPVLRSMVSRPVCTWAGTVSLLTARPRPSPGTVLIRAVGLR